MSKPKYKKKQDWAAQVNEMCGTKNTRMDLQKSVRKASRRGK